MAAEGSLRGTWDLSGRPRAWVRAVPLCPWPAGASAGVSAGLAGAVLWVEVRRRPQQRGAGLSCALLSPNTVQPCGRLGLTPNSSLF